MLENGLLYSSRFEYITNVRSEHLEALPQEEQISTPRAIGAMPVTQPRAVKHNDISAGIWDQPR